MYKDVYVLKDPHINTNMFEEPENRDTAESWGSEK